MIAPVPAEKTMNWAAFGAASEQARAYAGMPADKDFIENQIKSQMFAFDEKGMYRDPTEPMVYDFVTRLQLAVALYCGYHGECHNALEEELIKGAELTLKISIEKA